LNRIGFRVYLITDPDPASLPSLSARVEAALGALPRGAAAVQLRLPGAGGRALCEAARALVEVTRARGAPLLVNDRLDVALAAGADGVHLPSRGLPVEAARRIAPALLVGVSTHSRAEAERAARAGADLVTFGPVWATPSKAGLGEPVGPGALADTVTAVAIPVFALGGVDLDRASACLSVGARLACIRAVLGAPSPAEAAGALAARLASHDAARGRMLS
jgi:thiamine-phosphate pyrophosphorylase